MQISRVGDMVDVSQPQHGVEIQIRKDGKVVWVNVDGVCMLRVSQIDFPIQITRQKTDVGDGAEVYADRVVVK